MRWRAPVPCRYEGSPASGPASPCLHGGYMRIQIIAATLCVASAVVGLSGPARAEKSWGDTTVTNVVVNGGKDVSVGIAQPVAFQVEITAVDDSGIRGTDFYLHQPGSGYLDPITDVTCVASSATESTCRASVIIDPRVDVSDNGQAGTWYVDVWVDANDGGWFTSDRAGSFTMLRNTRLITKAGPEPVVSRGTIAVSGVLSRANWESSGYLGYGEQQVRLQFRTPDGPYRTVKTVNVGPDGVVNTTVTASVDGCWRWRFGGSATTRAVESVGDCVDVL